MARVGEIRIQTNVASARGRLHQALFLFILLKGKKTKKARK